MPQLRELRPRPALETVKAEVAVAFGVHPGNCSPGRRSDDAGRAVAAYLARRRFGYSAAAVASALGYRDHGGVGQAVRRIERANPQLQQTVERLEQKLLNT